MVAIEKWLHMVAGISDILASNRTWSQSMSDHTAVR
jgi:hypothetical protein